MVLLQLIAKWCAIFAPQKKAVGAYYRGAKRKKPGMRVHAGLCRWWAHQDSNLGPMDYESTALTN